MRIEGYASTPEMGPRGGYKTTSFQFTPPFLLLSDSCAYLQIDSDGSYFIQTVNPWCKEDALLVMLNATPSKKSLNRRFSHGRRHRNLAGMGTGFISAYIPLLFHALADNVDEVMINNLYKVGIMH